MSVMKVAVAVTGLILGIGSPAAITRSDEGDHPAAEIQLSDEDGNEGRKDDGDDEIRQVDEDDDDKKKRKGRKAGSNDGDSRDRDRSRGKSRGGDRSGDGDGTRGNDGTGGGDNTNGGGGAASVSYDPASAGGTDSGGQSTG